MGFLKSLNNALETANSATRLFVAKDGYVRDPGTRQWLYQRDGGKCGICGKAVSPSKWDADHVKPRSQGGSADLDNFRVTHPSCNKRRGNELQW